jgi:hypothetical protein
MYTDVLGRLRNEVSRKLSEKRKIKIWFPLYAIPPALRSVSVQDFSAKNNVDYIKASHIIPDLAAANFYLFPRLKSASMRRRFCAADIINNATEELKRLSQNGFLQYFHLYSCWQKCIFEKKGITLKEM